MFAATPFADAAAGKAKTTRTPAPVAHARYADNAARVNGYRATATPTAHTLLPLDASGRFPSSVLPRGTGPAAPPAAQPAGPRGPRDRQDPAVSTPPGS